MITRSVLKGHSQAEREQQDSTIVIRPLVFSTPQPVEGDWLEDFSEHRGIKGEQFTCAFQC